MSEIKDLIIIGAGPAGYTAAIYAARADLSVLCFEGWQPGGQLTTTTTVENFPGFEKGIDGKQLMQEMKKQAAVFGTEYITRDITKVDFSRRPFRVFEGENEYQAKTVIIATGAKPRKLGLESEERFWAKGVSACATCDGFFFRDKTVAVIGGGDSAMEEADLLSKFAKKVYIVHRREEFRASRIMLDRVRDNSKIAILISKAVDEILGDQKVTGLRLRDIQSGKISELAVDGIFLAIGHVPATGIFKSIEKDDLGYIIHKQNTMTNVAGVFAAGDCVDHRYRQAITAAGMGCQAAIDAERWLAGQ
ncbi:thioredoxin-disulfide reductase [Patescibacteria group bacterium]|nr:thioredoxin-disulfide reductase [Patescibacteria group bacterium]MBU1016217.1 thioredoxin-disulfide reductase [Patescibacteria group bacterium]MBU1684666.1 thioredoxin-disulfide reductase [Patescibacteria group bacterium]MBU1938917.1 thioredoxin-disulfide reductase [Patescibacteria group bacterium]